MAIKTFDEYVNEGTGLSKEKYQEELDGLRDEFGDDTVDAMFTSLAKYIDSRTSGHYSLDAIKQNLKKEEEEEEEEEDKKDKKVDEKAGSGIANQEELEGALNEFVLAAEKVHDHTMHSQLMDHVVAMKQIIRGE